MKIKAVFLNQWHQTASVRDTDLGTLEDPKTIPVPVGTVFLRVEIAEDVKADGR